MPKCGSRRLKNHIKKMKVALASASVRSGRTMTRWLLVISLACTQYATAARTSGVRDVSLEAASFEAMRREARSLFWEQADVPRMAWNSWQKKDSDHPSHTHPGEDDGSYTSSLP